MSKETEESDKGKKSCCGIQNLALTYAAILLRLWLAVRAIQTGLEKYSTKLGSEELVKIGGQPNDYGLTASEKVKVYGRDFYHGVPESLMKMFEKEPFLNITLWTFKDPEKAPITLLTVYSSILGPALIILGVTILIGFASRTSLFLLGLLYISLTWGLILINQNDGVAWLGTHMVLIAMALMIADHNRLAILKKW